jgi:hypothetical protein
LSDSAGCTVKSISCKLWLCADAQSKIQRIIVDGRHPHRFTALKFLEFRFKVLEWCGKLAIPLYPRATKADTFNKRYYTAGQALHPPPAAAVCGKPQGIKPFLSSFAQSCPCKHGRDFAPFVNNNCDYPELSKDWDWINQEFPLVEGLDLSTFTAEAECLPHNCMEQLNTPL